MRASLVRRFALVLSAAILAGAVVFERLARPSSDEEAAARAKADGAALFAGACGSCHATEDLRPAVQQLDAAGIERLLDFLEGHGDAPRDDDRIIVRFLTDAH